VLELLHGLLELLVPPSCAACGAGVEGDAALCRRCDAALPRLPRSLCLRCQAVTPTGPGDLCGACAAAASPLAACVAAVAFADDVERWIRRFKYPRKGIAGLDPAAGAVARALVREAAGRCPGPPPGLVVPVPLHPRRLRARGFNPAERLARALARDIAVRLDPVALRRVRDTPSQTGLERRERQRNVRGAFRARHGLRLPARVWLVDDVVTTGSTLTEAARALRRAGVRTVVGVCAARTRAGISSGGGPPCRR
jgi:ComF family protein